MSNVEYIGQSWIEKCKNLEQQLQTAKEENEKLKNDLEEWKLNAQLPKNLLAKMQELCQEQVKTLIQQNKQMREEIKVKNEALEKIVNEQPEKYLSNQGWSYFHKFKAIAQQALNQAKGGE